jgi:aminoglycoside 6-adenylyltransferase
MDQPRILRHILEWAALSQNIRVVILTGSLARGPEQVHPLSDIDVELYVSRPAELLDDDSWYQQFGEVLVVEALPNPGWQPTRLVYYVDAKIDFMIAPLSALAATKYQRPFQVLIDKDGLGTRLPPPDRSIALPPTQDEFLECINWFYAAAIMCAKCIVRNDPWQSRYRDWDLKQQLLRMLEWDHKARHGWAYDTWSKGKRLKEWLDTDLLADLDACWSGFGEAESGEALLHSIELFDRLTRCTADEVGYPAFDSNAVRHEVVRILALANFS